MPLNKFEGVVDRNFVTYNPQVVRNDVFMLGLDSTVKNHRMAVIRSSSAVLVGTLVSVATLTSVMWMVKTGTLPQLLFR